MSLISVLCNIFEQLVQKAFFCFPQSCDHFHWTGMAFFPTDPACLTSKLVFPRSQSSRIFSFYCSYELKIFYATMCRCLGLRIEYLRQWAISSETLSEKVKAFTHFFGFVICYSSCLPRLLGHSKQFIRRNKHIFGVHFFR